MILLALALAAHSSIVDARLPRAPTDLWRVRWAKSLVEADALEWKVREPGGPAIDPLTGVVVVGTRDGVLHGRTAEGRALWTFDAKAGFPASPAIANGTVYAGSSDGTLYALDLASGRERWRYVAGEEVGTTPAVANGTVYVTTLQDTLVAVDASTGAWKWHHRRESPSGFTIRGAAGPTVEGGTVFGAFSDGTVVALDAANGSVRWQRKVGPDGQYVDVDSTPILKNGRLYVAAYSGAVVALDAASGREIWSFRTPGPSRLALAGDVLVAVTPSQLVGVSIEGGEAAWTTPLDGEPAGPPLAVGKRVFVPATRGLVAVDAATGRRLVTFDPGTGVSASPALHERRMYVLSNGGTLTALDLR